MMVCGLVVVDCGRWVREMGRTIWDIGRWDASGWRSLGDGEV